MNSLCKRKDMLFMCFVLKLWNKNITQMRQKQKTTLRFISDIHIHAFYKSEKKKKERIVLSPQFWVIYTILRDSVQKEMLRYYVVSFKHDFFSPRYMVSALRFCL